MNTTDRQTIIGCTRTVCEVMVTCARAITAAMRTPADRRVEFDILSEAEEEIESGLRSLPSPDTDLEEL